MKIEFTIPEELTLQYLYGPSMVDRGKHFGPGWLAHCVSTESKTYFGAHGVGATPQAAIDHCLRQANEYIARHPQGAYNVNVPSIDLDLTDILGGL